MYALLFILLYRFVEVPVTIPTWPLWTTKVSVSNGDEGHTSSAMKRVNVFICFATLPTFLRRYLSFVRLLLWYFHRLSHFTNIPVIGNISLKRKDNIKLASQSPWKYVIWADFPGDWLIYILSFKSIPFIALDLVSNNSFSGT